METAKEWRLLFNIGKNETRALGGPSDLCFASATGHPTDGERHLIIIERKDLLGRRRIADSIKSGSMHFGPADTGTQ